MKTHIRKLFIVLPLALLLLVGALASTSGIASARALTTDRSHTAVHVIHVQKVVHNTCSTSKSFAASAQQTSCQWYGSVPSAPWQQVMAFQYVYNSNIIVLAQLESAGPPVVVNWSTKGLSGLYSGPAQMPVPGTFNAILFGYPNITDPVCKQQCERVFWRFLPRFLSPTMIHVPSLQG